MKLIRLPTVDTIKHNNYYSITLNLINTVRNGSTNLRNETRATDIRHAQKAILLVNILITDRK